MNRYLIGSIIWAIVILVLTLTPGKSIPDVSLFDYDKIGHAGIFCIFSFLLIAGLSKSVQGGVRKVGLIGIIGSALYGLVIEFVQQFIPDRGMEWYDALANMTGSFLGFCLFYVWHKQIQNSKT